MTQPNDNIAPADDGRKGLQPGDLIAFPDASWRGEPWRLARVVKVGKVMWEVEKFNPRLGFDRASRLKILRYQRVAGDPVEIQHAFNAAREEMWAAEKEAQRVHGVKVAEICARFAEDPHA